MCMNSSIFLSINKILIPLLRSSSRRSQISWRINGAKPRRLHPGSGTWDWSSAHGRSPASVVRHRQLAAHVIKALSKPGQKLEHPLQVPGSALPLKLAAVVTGFHAPTNWETPGDLLAPGQFRVAQPDSSAGDPHEFLKVDFTAADRGHAEMELTVGFCPCRCAPAAWSSAPHS